MNQNDVVTERIVRKLDACFLGQDRWDIFRERLIRQFPELYPLLMQLYGGHYDVHLFMEQLVTDIWEAFRGRPGHLLKADRNYIDNTPWFLSEKAVGAVCYVDLFAGSFKDLAEKVGYLSDLGITYLHLMPIYKTPEGASDGGYAVADYRSFQEGLGSAEDLRSLADVLHAAGIVLSLDFVLNHTSNQHEWALKALSGDPEYRKFYFIFPEHRQAAEYSRYLRDIFPEVRKGSFSWSEDMEAWVWTTFNSYQWDLNYQNHAVFRAMVREMLFLANIGADVLRFDAVAFMWKEKGTRCESLPKVHTLIKAFKLASALAVPELAFKSEAIVHPAEVLEYIKPNECQLSYNPLLMAETWEAAAVRNPALLRRSIETRLQIPEKCAWVNYVRCHDDIGWTFDDADAAALGIDGYSHRRFLNDFYTGKFPGSFSRGLPFQENMETGDCRISGTCASLAGLEKSLETGNQQQIDNAVRRIVLMYGLAASAGGFPLLYLGDEYGMLNDYSYLEHPDHYLDSRWVHRMPFDWSCAESAAAADTPAVAESAAGRIHRALLNIFSSRKHEPAFAGGGGNGSRIVDHGHRWILGFSRTGPEYDILVLANFSDSAQEIARDAVFSGDNSSVLTDLLSGKRYPGRLVLQPWELLWLKPDLEYSTVVKHLEERSTPYG
ncbi:MAG: amylosucrase [Spirochaetia bacterium]|nr:amylosucrase [Spirochaetia bacterium]